MWCSDGGGVGRDLDGDGERFVPRRTAGKQRRLKRGDPNELVVPVGGNMSGRDAPNGIMRNYAGVRRPRRERRTNRQSRSRLRELRERRERQAQFARLLGQLYGDRRRARSPLGSGFARAGQRSGRACARPPDHGAPCGAPQQQRRAEHPKAERCQIQKEISRFGTRCTGQLDDVDRERYDCRFTCVAPCPASSPATWSPRSASPLPARPAARP